MTGRPRWTLVPSALALAVALAAGCVETKQDYAINPDGSGKVDFSLVFIPGQIGRLEDPQLVLLRSVREVLETSRGVEAWKDVTFEHRRDGRIWFKGTAYFPRLAGLKLHLMKQGGLVWHASSPDGPYLELRDPNPPTGIARPVRDMTDEAVAAEVAAQRAAWAQKKTLMAPYIASFDIQVSCRLPGRVGTVSGFEITGRDRVRIAFDGEAMFRAMDALVADDAFMERAVRAGENVLQAGPGVSRIINQRVFGLEGPATAEVEGHPEPVFNYAAEVKEAKAAEPAMRKRLGLGAPAEPEDAAPARTPKG